MAELSGAKILITGPAGQIAFPLAEYLARNNEVWGISRFGDAATRKACEDAGITTRVVDLAEPDWSELPPGEDAFDYILHLAIFQQPGWDFDRALRVNSEGTGLLMSRFRGAKACLVMSTCSVYAPAEDAHLRVVETDRLGSPPQPFSPTYPASKIAQEGIARFCAREWNLPTTIARMNVSYGPNGGLPAYQLEAILQGEPVEIVAGRPSICSLIHQDDINAQTAGLLEAASVPAMILNWGGDDANDVEDYCTYMGELVGKKPEFRGTDVAITHTCTNNDRRVAVAGRCKVGWREGLRRMIEERHPEIDLIST